MDISNALMTLISRIFPRCHLLTWLLLDMSVAEWSFVTKTCNSTRRIDEPGDKQRRSVFFKNIRAAAARSK